MLQVRGQTSKSVIIKRRINSFCSIVRKVVCTVVTKIKMNRFIFIFLVVISLGISVFCIRKKYTHAVDDEQYPILVRLTEGKFLKPVAERNKKESSAVVKFWWAKGKFKTKDGALMYNGKKVSVAIIFL